MGGFVDGPITLAASDFCPKTFGDEAALEATKNSPTSTVPAGENRLQEPNDPA